MSSSPTLIELGGVSVRFRRYSAVSTGLKEGLLRLIDPPEWFKHQKANPKSAEFWGLKDVTLKLQEGSRLGIIGRNGAGKSTLLKVICRIYRPTEGNLNVQGRIAPLIEIGGGFNPELSGRENIFLNAAILGIPRKAIAQRVDSIIKFAELEEFIDAPVKYYSTGMHLRLAFTIATELEPDILILDELYAGGDASFIEKANVRMRNFLEKSKILILVAHNLEYIREFCTDVVVLDKGQIIGHGKPEEMITRYLAMCHGDANAFSGNA